MIAVYLLVVMNSRKIMGDNVNRLIPNILGVIVVLIATGLGIRSILHVIGILRNLKKVNILDLQKTPTPR